MGIAALTWLLISVVPHRPPPIAPLDTMLDLGFESGSEMGADS